jgi:hypothetical protein
VGWANGWAQPEGPTVAGAALTQGTKSCIWGIRSRGVVEDPCVFLRLLQLPKPLGILPRELCPHEPAIVPFLS